MSEVRTIPPGLAAKVSRLASTVIGETDRRAHRSDMNLASFHVIVVGAATAGAGAALLLARAGARVTLIERIAAPRAVGAGIALAENGLAVLESIGLLPAITHVARTVPAPRLVDGNGRVLLDITGPTPRVLMTRRADLQSILLDAVAAEPRITTCFGAEVISSDCVGNVDVRTPDGERRLSGNLVIGADGVHSRIREAGDHGARVADRGVTYVRALVEGAAGRGEEAWTRAGLFGSFDVPGGTYLYASAGSRAARSALAARDLGAFCAAWTDAHAPAGELFARVETFDQLLINQVLRVSCERWFDRKQVLVGDAAHAMPPNLGQGANSALVDVAVLLDELRRADDLFGALVAYERRRKPAVERVAKMAGRLGALAEMTNPVARWVRDRIVLPIASRFAGPTPTATVYQEPIDTLLAIGRT